MKLFHIGAGILLLLNPVMGVHDYLPDFVGCFLIMFGIRDAAYMIEKLRSSERWFMYGAFISILRFAVSFLNVESQHTLPLTLAFSFAVVELIVYIPAFKELFAGFDYAAMRHGGTGVLSIGRRMGFYNDESGVRQYGEIQDDTTGRLAAAFMRFMVIRAAMSVLPELPALQLTESENVGDISGFQFASIGNLIRLAAAVAVLVPGVILLVRSVRFLRQVHKSGDFIPGIMHELESRFGDLSEMHTCGGMKLTSYTAGAAVLLYMGFYDYQMNVIPRFVPAIVLCAASVMLFMSSGKRAVNLLPVLPAIGTIPLSIRTYALQKEHYGIYKAQMMALYESGNEYFYDRNINEMNDEYLRMAAVESLEAIVLGVAVVLFLVFYMRLCLKHTAQFASIPERDRVPLGRSLRLRGAFMIGGAVLSAVYFTAYRFILPYFDAAPIVGIGVNLLSVGMFAAFALQANQYAYGNNYEI